MKKKIFAGLLAMVMMLSFATTALAADAYYEWELAFDQQSNGSNNDQVLVIQRVLQQRGYGITVDGIFGDNTENAVEAFQRSADLDDDGIVGPDTWDALQAQLEFDYSDANFNYYTVVGSSSIYFAFNYNSDVWWINHSGWIVVD